MESEKYKKLEKCRVCKNTDLTEYLDLGNVPLANALITEEQIKDEEKFPLKVLFCNNCSFSQLSIIVDPDVMFRNYVYRSSISNSFIQHCKEIVEELKSDFLMKNELVVDIASNDGCLLKEFKAKGFRVLGIDPAVNLAKIANEQGIETIADYWNPELAKQLTESHGKAKAIIAINVFAHINNLHSMVEGVRIMLEDDGYFIIESPHLLDLIEKTEFDTIYHEHLSYLLVKPLQKLMKEHGLRIAKVKKTSIHGGSIRMYIEKQEKEDTSDGSTQKIIDEEEKMGLHKLDGYTGFVKKVEKVKVDLNELVNKLKSEGKTVAGFGASAKGNTLLNYCGIGKEKIDFIIDDTPEKQRKLYPGVHIPVVSRENLFEKKPDYLLLLAWNFADEIIKKTEDFRKKGGKYIVPIPEVKVVD